MVEEAWPHFHSPWTLGFSHLEVFGVSGTTPPLLYLPAFECVTLSPQNSFFSLHRRIPTNFQEPAQVGQRVSLVTTLPQWAVGNSLICAPTQTLKTQTAQSAVSLPHQSP